MKPRFILVFILGLCLTCPASAEFIGRFEIGPAGCKDKGECILTYDLKFRDPKGVEWLAAAKDRTDGASIPSWAQPFIGGPFDESYIKAAIIHDHYCDRHVRPWRDTHRAFYDALVELGISDAKAKLMYYAVYLGGPKWVELIPGKSCGDRCVFKVETAVAGVTQNQASQIVSRASSYDDPDFLPDLKEVEKLIREHGDKVDLKFLERRAEKNHPDDYFYKNGDRVVLGGGPAIK